MGLARSLRVGYLVCLFVRYVGDMYRRRIFQSKTFYACYSNVHASLIYFCFVRENRVDFSCD